MYGGTAYATVPYAVASAASVSIRTITGHSRITIKTNRTIGGTARILIPSVDINTKPYIKSAQEQVAINRILPNF